MYCFLPFVPQHSRISFTPLSDKKKDVGSLCVHVTNQTIIVALTPDAMSHSFGEANEAVKKIAAYLVGQGY